MKPQILLAEDDPNLGFVTTDHLIHEGFDVVHTLDGSAAFEQFVNQTFDCCVIDVMMPKMDGFSLAKKIRERDESVPILFLTAKSMEEDRLKGFEIGGDDYVTKPFSMAELTYRIKVFLRRSEEAKGESDFISIGKLQYDQKNLSIHEGSERVLLTQREADLLTMLLKNRNKLVKREDILISIWGEDDYFKGRSLDVFISRLRKYFKNDTSIEIRNHHGVGFTLVDNNFSG